MDFSEDDGDEVLECRQDLTVLLGVRNARTDWKIVKNCPFALQIQRELVDEQKDIGDTAAGEVVDRELEEEMRKSQEEMRKPQETTKIEKQEAKKDSSPQQPLSRPS